MALIADRTEHAAAELDFRRTVDRTLVHRRALSEVFLTDFRATTEGRFVAAAQLPPSHAYYTDHLTVLPVIDPLLVVECCRQAETYAGHELVGVPLGHRFVLREWSVELDGLAGVRIPSVPAELIITGATSDRVERAGKVRGITFGMELALAGSHVGSARMVVAYLPPSAYDLLRSGRRGGPPPISDDLREPREGSPVAPARVGRRSPANVVLTAVETARPHATAELSVPFVNPSMFDHAQDHVPGMVLMEGARQLALAALAEGRGSAVANLAVMTLAAKFSQYAELDTPTRLRAETVAGTGSLSRRTTARVSFEQDGTPIAHAVIGLADLVTHPVSLAN